MESKMDRLHRDGYFITRIVMDEAIRLPSRYAPALYGEKLLIAATGMVGQLALKLHRHPSAYLVLSCITPSKSMC